MDNKREVLEHTIAGDGFQVTFKSKDDLVNESGLGWEMDNGEKLPEEENLLIIVSTQLQSVIDDQRREINELRALVGQDASVLYESLRSQIFDLKTENAQLLNTIKGLQAEIDADWEAREKVEDASEAEVGKIEDKVDALEGEIEELKARVKELEEIRSNQLQEIDDLNDEIEAEQHNALLLANRIEGEKERNRDNVRFMRYSLSVLKSLDFNKTELNAVSCFIDAVLYDLMVDRRREGVSTPYYGASLFSDLGEITF